MRDKFNSNNLLLLLVSCLIVTNIFIVYSNEGIKNLLTKDQQEYPAFIFITSSDTPSFKEKSPEEGLKEALRYYDIKHPNIVYKQAILETGHFKSKVCKEYNNLFGLYNSKTKQYFKFNHWWESVLAYKTLIQYKYNGNSKEEYYKFLKNLPYAEDELYIKKLKNL